MSRIALSRVACMLALTAASLLGKQVSGEENPSFPQAEEVRNRVQELMEYQRKLVVGRSKPSPVDATAPERDTFTIVPHGPHSGILLDTRSGQTWRLTGGNDEWEWIEVEKRTEGNSKHGQKLSKLKDEEIKKLKEELEKTADKLAQARLDKTNASILAKEFRTESLDKDAQIAGMIQRITGLEKRLLDFNEANVELKERRAELQEENNELIEKLKKARKTATETESEPAVSETPAPTKDR